MSPYVMAPAAPVSIEIHGQAGRFPVGRVYCIGRNYRWPGTPAIAAEERPAPYYFMKPADAVVPADGALPMPPLTRDFCHEIELVVAIGREAVNVPAAQALDHVWGYAIGLDLTRRDLQAQAKQAGQPWEGAKAFDASAPVAALHPVSACGHPARGAIWLAVNGSERQRADLADLIWSVPELIAFVSASVRLKAGDLIFTGTPAGVGALAAGDVVTGGIDGLGAFTMTVQAGQRTGTALHAATPCGNGA